MKFKLFLIITLFSAIFTSDIYSQDFIAEVIVDMEALPTDAKDRLRDFKQQTEDYLNKNKFHFKEIPPVKCTFQFNFRSASGLDGYDATLFVVSQREIYRQNKNEEIKYTQTFRILDDRVYFNYNRSMQFTKNDVIFDSYLSMLNYYAYMVLGYDEDTYHPVGGSSLFQKALDICNKPISDRRGWTETGGGSKPSRLQLAQEILSAKFVNYRKGFFEYHWMGLDSLSINRTSGYKNILNALTKIYNVKKNEVRSFNIDIFFDEKHKEIADAFLNYGNKNVYTTLIQYDVAHQSVYEEARKRAR